jgi:hypothetical protein
VAVASAFLPIALVAWIAWQTMEGDNETLLRSQFVQWAWTTLEAAAVTCLAAATFWRSRRTYGGVVVGVVLAGVAVLCGLAVDLVGSGGLA